MKSCYDQIKLNKHLTVTSPERAAADPNFEAQLVARMKSLDRQRAGLTRRDVASEKPIREASRRQMLDNQRQARELAENRMASRKSIDTGGGTTGNTSGSNIQNSASVDPN